MKIELFCLCDAATNENGKLNLLGTYDTLRVSALPAVHPYCAVAMRIRFSSMENGPHTVVISIIDEDGSKFIPPLKGAVEVYIPDGETTAAFNFVFNLQQLKFVKAGEYGIDLIIDGKVEGSLPMMVRMNK